MGQRTVVVKVAKAKYAELRSRFGAGTFEFRSVPHAAFSVKGEGAVATLYNSGKFVVQSDDPEGFLARFTDLDVPTTKQAAAADPLARMDGPLIGSDETGKGDYFGPLVVAAVRLEPDEGRELTQLGVSDSKQLTDDRALQLGAYLREKVAHALVCLDPPDYNGRYPNYTGLNPLLADLHAEAIREVAQPGDRVLVDQFAAERVMREALAGVDIELTQAHRAERNVAVAAASVLARAEFLLRLRELSAQWDVDLRKGAGEPVDEAGARFVRDHGHSALAQVAKMHFKNTAKIEARVARG